jgi:pimeloyl-ACP methyl ester carboxylesterase
MTSPPSHLQPADLQGYARLAIAAVAGITDLVEAMHGTIANPLRREPRTRGITGLVYRTIGGVTRVVGGGLDLVLGQLPSLIAARTSTAERDAVLAALNGVLGDYLEASNNPLAIAMSLRCNGEPLVVRNLPAATGKVLVLVHGLCMNDRQWRREGHDHGAALARELGYTPIYLNYNSGRHISTNGREFAEQLEATLADWPLPIDTVTLIGHSMGGLVARSTCAAAAELEHTWIKKLDKLIFLGTPHHGAPLERGGSWVDVILGATPWSAPFARLGKVRSAGITDLRHGNVLDEHWRGHGRFERAEERGRALPLPEGVSCYAVAASLGTDEDSLKGAVLGDGLVPVASALGRHSDPARALAIPKARQMVCWEMGHMALLSRPEVYERLRKWLKK